MLRHHFIGPITKRWAQTYWHDAGAPGANNAFGYDSDLGPSLQAEDNWEAFARRCWPLCAPSFVALWLPYTSIPDWLWTAPVPLVGLAADANVLWHHYRAALTRCDLVLADATTAEAVTRADEGINGTQLVQSARLGSPVSLRETGVERQDSQ